MSEKNQNRTELEGTKRFSESLFWSLNRKYYEDIGIDAWQSGAVPHHLTSNSMVGLTYAKLIFSLLTDIGRKGNITEPVYILELGAGHGKLAYHVLVHLDRLIDESQRPMPPYCYILSDIVENNLEFFEQHHQLQPYLQSGKLDIAYFDAIESNVLDLRVSKKVIHPSSLNQPMIALANYFFDSLPIDVFLYRQGEVEECLVSVSTTEQIEDGKEPVQLEKLELNYNLVPLEKDRYEDAIINEIVNDYKSQVFNSFIFIPELSIKCIDNLKSLSQNGVIFLSMDKGFHEIHDLENTPAPKLVNHGSISLSVNYHALSSYCLKSNGTVMMPEASTFYLELACMMFVNDGEDYFETKATYQQVVNDFGPDDYNEFKGFFYKHIAQTNLQELFGFLRLSAYDSTIFIHILPRIKQLIKEVTFNERRRMHQTMNKVWANHYELDLKFDVALEIGGIMYDLGFYQEALNFYLKSSEIRGISAMGYYNLALCYYQLREDKYFSQTLIDAKSQFPDFEKYDQLLQLDLLA